jgi:hypothetical protein
MRKLIAEGFKGNLKTALAVYRIAEELGVLDAIRPRTKLDLSGLTPEERKLMFESYMILQKVRPGS